MALGFMKYVKYFERGELMECKTCLGDGYVSWDEYGEATGGDCPDCKGTGTVADESTAYGTDCKGGGCE